jgi:hypothetical protein
LKKSPFMMRSSPRQPGASWGIGKHNASVVSTYSTIACRQLARSHNHKKGQPKPPS